MRSYASWPVQFSIVICRLAFDRETGKPKGYGLCEFAGIPLLFKISIANVSYSCHLPNHKTALSAVRNLNGTDVGGRPLRIDLAD